MNFKNCLIFIQLAIFYSLNHISAFFFAMQIDSTDETSYYTHTSQRPYRLEA